MGHYCSFSTISIIQMSLTSILKEIDRVNERQKEVERRYNRKSRGCPRQEDLEREELQDQRIYGYSHSHLLQMFKQTKCENVEQTRPCTAVQSRPFTSPTASTKWSKQGNQRRAQSAVKVASYKQQYNFLFKEDIFDQNYERTKYTSSKNEDSQQNERRMSRMLLNKAVPKTVKKMHSKSIKAERINFVKSFDENLNRIQNKNKKRLVKTNKNFVFYNRKEATPVQAQVEHEDFFKLTKAVEKEPFKKFKIVLSSSLDNLKEQQSLINQPQIGKLNDFTREASIGRYSPLMDTNFIDFLPNKFYLTCIIMETLQSVRFKLSLKNGAIILEDTKEALNLNLVFSQLISSHSLVHLIFHNEQRQLLYQQILINQSFRNIQNKQHEILLLMYYLKRFLMFDPLSTFKSVQESADLLLKSNIDLPDDFIDFVDTFKQKVCRIYDKDQRLYQFSLKSALSNALSSIIAFKKEMGFGQKVVKLKQGTRQEFKKYLYNWEYFYICFFLSLITQARYINLPAKLCYIDIMKAPKNQSVKVALRVRPLNKRETEMKSPLCVETKDNVLSIRKGTDTKDFVFDYVFGIQTTQVEVYEACGYSLVENSLEGFNGTVFAYGQTGAGKTFSMVGDYKNQEWKGIIPRAFDHVINAIQTSQNRRYVVRASFIEIYNEEIFDLLDMKGDVKKDLKESPQTGVFVKDLKTIPVKSVDEMFKLLDYGNKNRSVAQTNMNATSSRSHALFTVHIESIEGDDKIKGSKLNFVDLAGSERQGKTGASGDTLKEGAKINLSLTALGNVINALVDGKKGGHIPYRDSKLTRMLQDSLGGNTKTLMIASVSPAEDNYDETVSTLRYAARARNIKNTPKVNEDPKDALIKEYMAEIEKLRKQLGSGGVQEISETSQELLQELERAKEKEKELTQKQAQLLEMKLKMKEMEQLIMKKQNNPDVAKIAQKRKLEKKKFMKQQQLNEYKVRELEEEEKKDLEDTEAQDKKDDINYWKNLAKKLKKKLKASIQDKKDQSEEFEDERERLNECIRNMEGNLSFYKQIAEKFLSLSDLTALLDQSQFDYQTRAMTIPPFLLHDQKLSLPKTLKKHEVDDLWKEKRKGYKMEMLKESLPQLNNKSNVFDIPQSKSSVFSKDYKEPQSSPFVQNRRILKYLNSDEKYQSKWSEGSGETIFRNTHFKIRDTSNSANKRPSSKMNSRTKLQAISKDNKKVETSQEKTGRPLSRAKLLEPISK